MRDRSTMFLIRERKSQRRQIAGGRVEVVWETSWDG